MTETIQYLCVWGTMYLQQQLLVTTNQPPREEREKDYSIQAYYIIFLFYSIIFCVDGITGLLTLLVLGTLHYITLHYITLEPHLQPSIS